MIVATTWASRPDRVREQADQLVLQDNRLGAIREIWNCGIEPRPSLRDCQVIVAERYRELGDRVQSAPEPPRDLATLISQVQAELFGCGSW